MDNNKNNDCKYFKGMSKEELEKLEEKSKNTLAYKMRELKKEFINLFELFCKELKDV